MLIAWLNTALVFLVCFFSIDRSNACWRYALACKELMQTVVNMQHVLPCNTSDSSIITHLPARRVCLSSSTGIANTRSQAYSKKLKV